jgi:hypothetical protein
MSRRITITIDMDDLPGLVEQSARTCLKAHDISLPDEYFREIGNNVAAGIVSVGDMEQNTDRLELWAHIVSEHCNMAPPGSVSSMLDYHEGEHEGPGTIRNHDPHSYHYSLRKLAAVLGELEPEDSDS